MSTDETIPLSKRQATRNAKIAVLTMLEEAAAAHLSEAAYCVGIEHDNLLTQAQADSALADSLAKKWYLKRIHPTKEAP